MSGNKLPRMRYMDECYKELHKMDAACGISKRMIKAIADSGAIPVVRMGNRCLINLDALIEYLTYHVDAAPEQEENKIAPIPEKIRGGLYNPFESFGG